VVEGLVLPERALRREQLVDAARRDALDPFQDAMQRDDGSAIVVERRKKKMNVFGHHYGAVQQDGFIVRIDAVLEDDGASFRRKGIAAELAERDEEWTAGFLEVRQATAVLVGTGGKMNHWNWGEQFRRTSAVWDLVAAVSVTG